MLDYEYSCPERNTNTTKRALCILNTGLDIKMYTIKMSKSVLPLT